jgi:hypothetical protein
MVVSSESRFRSGRGERTVALVAVWVEVAGSNVTPCALLTRSIPLSISGAGLQAHLPPSPNSSM